MAKEYYFSLEEQAKFYGYELKEEKPKAKTRKERHNWTAMENAVIYMVWALEANKPGVNPRHLAGGQVKYEMADMVKQVRELGNGQFDKLSDDAILMQLSRCGYKLMETNNDFADITTNDMFLELHRELKIWDGRVRLHSNNK